ncbi:MAG TPA: type III pantothenate kinase [Oxalicibacterium sp.]|uniref:type III pantothenate kinase n=1 Tax=Oxalicibacterium sp. TaxID=2766525 RepID=UPI002B54BF4E|nr:type III pantothenate kinase [Oxalicibacterium sp.]HWU99364.1 type III pantothenate kinase [Oxalicibacterium sp.]
MLLLVDAGNTRIKWALVDRSVAHPVPGVWHAAGSVARADAEQLVQIWRALRIGRVLLSNVAGDGLRDELERIVLRALGSKPVAIEWFASVAEFGGVRNLYRTPSQLGCDRLAAAIGARALFPQRALVVATCGTATTIDAVSANGDFIGGMILPGLGLMASSLAKNTAQLPEVASQMALQASSLQPFADNTDAAIVSGCLAAQAGAIERAVAAHVQANRKDDVTCILAGGAADLVAPHLSIAHQRVDNLVLLGLQTVALGLTSSC